MTVKDSAHEWFSGEYKPTIYKSFFPAFLVVLIICKHLFLLYLDKIKKNQKDTFNFRLKIMD